MRTEQPTSKCFEPFLKLRARSGPKNRLLNAVVLPTDLYAFEAKRHNNFHLSCFGKLLKLSDKARDAIQRIQSVYSLSKLAQLRWTGHVKKVESMQRSGTETIRTQIQPSKQIREIT